MSNSSSSLVNILNWESLLIVNFLDSIDLNHKPRSRVEVAKFGTARVQHEKTVHGVDVFRAAWEIKTCRPEK